MDIVLLTIADFSSLLCSIFLLNNMKYLLEIMTVGVHVKPPEETMGRSMKWYCNAWMHFIEMF